MIDKYKNTDAILLDLNRKKNQDNHLCIIGEEGIGKTFFIKRFVQKMIESSNDKLFVIDYYGEWKDANTLSSNAITIDLNNTPLHLNLFDHIHNQSPRLKRKIVEYYITFLKGCFPNELSPLILPYLESLLNQIVQFQKCNTEKFLVELRRNEVLESLFSQIIPYYQSNAGMFFLGDTSAYFSILYQKSSLVVFDLSSIPFENRDFYLKHLMLNLSIYFSHCQSDMNPNTIRLILDIISSKKNIKNNMDIQMLNSIIELMKHLILRYHACNTEFIFTIENVRNLLLLDDKDFLLRNIEHYILFRQKKDNAMLLNRLGIISDKDFSVLPYLKLGEYVIPNKIF